MMNMKSMLVILTIQMAYTERHLCDSQDESLGIHTPYRLRPSRSINRHGLSGLAGNDFTERNKANPS